jgi:hypothetical protein
MKFNFNPFTGKLDQTANKQAEIPDIATTYLKLDCSNDPLTGDLSTNENVYLLDNKRIYLGAGNDLSLYHNGTNSIISNVTGELIFGSPTTVTIGTGAAGVDYVLKFDGESNDGTIKFMEDEKRFDFDCLVYMKAGFYADGDCQINGPSSFLYNNNTNGTLNIRSNGSGKLTLNVNNTGDGEICGGGGHLILKTIRSGATQAAAGAAAGELWKTSGHASLPDNVLLIGV